MANGCAFFLDESFSIFPSLVIVFPKFTNNDGPMFVCYPEGKFHGTMITKIISLYLHSVLHDFVIFLYTKSNVCIRFGSLMLIFHSFFINFMVSVCHSSRLSKLCAPRYGKDFSLEKKKRLANKKIDINIVSCPTERYREVFY